MLWEYEIKKDLKSNVNKQHTKGVYEYIVYNTTVYSFIIYFKNDLEHRYHIQNVIIFLLPGGVYYLGLLLNVQGRYVISHMCDLQI